MRRIALRVMLRAVLGRRGPVADTVITGRTLIEAARFTIAGDVLLEMVQRHAQCFGFDFFHGFETAIGQAQV